MIEPTSPALRKLRSYYERAKACGAKDEYGIAYNKIRRGLPPKKVLAELLAAIDEHEAGDLDPDDLFPEAAD